MTLFSRIRALTPLVALLVLVASCSAPRPKGAALMDPPNAFIGFPVVGDVDGIEMSAFVPKDGPLLFERAKNRPLRFIKENGLIPVRIEIKQRSAVANGESAPKLQGRYLEPRLILADGTVLKGLLGEQLRDSIERAYEIEECDRISMKEGSIATADELAETRIGNGYVYFQQPAGAVEWRGPTRLAFQRGEFVRDVSLLHSVVTLTFNKGGSTQTIAAGTQLGD